MLVGFCRMLCADQKVFCHCYQISWRAQLRMKINAATDYSATRFSVNITNHFQWAIFCKGMADDCVKVKQREICDPYLIGVMLQYKHFTYSWEISLYIGFQQSLVPAPNQNSVGIINQHVKKGSQTLILSITFNVFEAS